jgi:hypothetical protein
MAKAIFPVFSGSVWQFGALARGGFDALAMTTRRGLRLLAGVVCLLAFCVEVPALPSKQIITPTGPITRIVVGQDGSLQIEHQNYPGIGQFYPKTTWPADCGLFLRHDGKVDGIDYARHDGTMAYNAQAAPFQPVSQTQSTDGRLVSTVMDNSADGTGVPFKVTQYVSYFPGDSWILVSVVVKNESTSDQTVDLFTAADIYLADEDAGYPYLNLDCPQVAIGGANLTRTFNLFAQATPGSPQPTSYQEDFYATIWTIIGNNQHFANTTSSDYRDNGAGLEWQGVTIPAGGSFNVSHYWAFGTITCVEPPERAQAIHILWSGGTNMVLHWDQPGYVLQASTNSLCNWNPLPVPITDTEAIVGVDLQKKTFYRLARP